MIIGADMNMNHDGDVYRDATSIKVKLRCEVQTRGFWIYSESQNQSHAIATSTAPLAIIIYSLLICNHNNQIRLICLFKSLYTHE